MTAQLWLSGSPKARWVAPALLGWLAFADALTQGSLSAATLADVPLGVPASVLALLRDVGGIDWAATGGDLAMRLLRPVLVLSAVALYRALYALGVLKRQLELQVLGPGGEQARRLRTQWGALALLRRGALLASPRIVVVACFAAALDAPGVLGLLLLLGALLAPPALCSRPGGPGAARAAMPLERPCLAASQLLAGVWVALQYAASIGALREMADSSPTAVAAAAWLGVRLDLSGAGSATLGRVLALKLAVLAAIALRRRCIRWAERLPVEVHNEGLCGAPCPIFWPVDPDTPLPDVPAVGTADEGDAVLIASLLAPRVLLSAPLPVGSALQSAWTDVVTAFNRGLVVVQEYIDWPVHGDGGDFSGLVTPLPSIGRDASPERSIAAPGASAGAANAAGRPSRAQSTGASPAQASDAALNAATSEPSRSAGPASTVPAQGVAEGPRPPSALAALRAWAETASQSWNLDLTLLALLLSAFQCADVLSLPQLVLICIGMTCQCPRTAGFWRRWGLPLQGAMIVEQYLVLLGFGDWALARLPAMKPDVRKWIALEEPDPIAIAFMFVAYCLAVLQVQYAPWISVGVHRRHRSRQLASSRGADWLERPFLDGNSPPVAQASFGAGALPPLGPQRFVSRGPSVSAGAGAAPGSTYSGREGWTTIERVCFLVLRHSLHALLISVLILCTLENDIVHAGYLAIVLLLFRLRIRMRRRGRGLFWLLPAYNMAVVSVTLLYQAPFEAFFGWSLDTGPEACTLVHLLGLYKVPHGAFVFVWNYRCALADVVLWALIRLQTHLFASSAYRNAIAIVEEEEAAKSAALTAARRQQRRNRARQAVEASRMRADRALRVSRLKDLLSNSLGWKVVQGGEGGTSVASFVDNLVDGRNDEEPERDGMPAPADPANVASASDLASTPAQTSSSAPAAQTVSASTAVTASARSSSPFDAPHFASPLLSVLRVTSPPPESSTSSAPQAQAPSPRLGALTPLVAAWRSISGMLPQMDRESYLAYALFAIIFASDLSVLSMVYPLSAFLYALVSIQPAPAYWQALLVYSELLIVVTYAYQVPARLGCEAISTDLERRMSMLGVHSSRSRNVPLFLVYLATLMHCYSLTTRHEAAARARSASRLAHEAVQGLPGVASSRLESLPIPTTPSIRILDAETAADSIGSALSGLWALVADAIASACEFVLRACTAAERPPSFVLATVRVPETLAASRAMAPEVTATRVLRNLQTLLDASLREREEARFSPPAAANDANAASEYDNDDNGSGSGPDDGSSPGSDDDEPATPAGTHHPLERVPIMRAPLRLRNAELVSGPTPAGDGQCRLTVLAQVEALKTFVELPDGAVRQTGWPLRSLTPACDAAENLLRAGALPDPPSSFSTAAVVESVEHHATRAQDWYAATVLLDFISFVYIALFFNKVAVKTQSLSEITYEHVVPFKYLVTLIALFMLIILDRLVYTLGTPLGKALLHCTCVCEGRARGEGMGWPRPKRGDPVAAAAWFPRGI